jgi:ABC-type antimicrobial peptide transport system permease subunit
MGQRLWPGEDPIGKCVRRGADTMPCTYVVGVAENITQRNFTDDPGYYYYIPADQNYLTYGGLFVRVRGDARQFEETLRRRLQVDMPGASYVTITPLADIVGSQRQSWKLGATMFVAFGVLALVLAAIGLYSVIAYDVAQRTHELGVRVALGAQVTDVVRMVVGQGLALGGVGVGLGAIAALWAGHWVAPLLFKESPTDPVVFGIVVSLLIAVAAVGSWIPALRAARVDPQVALRAD